MMEEQQRFMMEEQQRLMMEERQRLMMKKMVVPMYYQGWPAPQ